MIITNYLNHTKWKIMHPYTFLCAKTFVLIFPAHSGGPIWPKKGIFTHKNLRNWFKERDYLTNPYEFSSRVVEWSSQHTMCSCRLFLWNNAQSVIVHTLKTFRTFLLVVFALRQWWSLWLADRRIFKYYFYLQTSVNTYLNLWSFFTHLEEIGFSCRCLSLGLVRILLLFFLIMQNHIFVFPAGRRYQLKSLFFRKYTFWAFIWLLLMILIVRWGKL